MMATYFFSSLPWPSIQIRVISICFPLIISLALVGIVSSISFNYTQFYPDSSNIKLQGDAVYSLGNIEMNIVTQRYRVGLITYGDNVRLWDKSSGKMSDFSTHFTFVVDTLGQHNTTKIGHGFTFFIAPVGFQTPPNSGGAYLGIFNTTTRDSSKNQMIVVEFDSYANSGFDPEYEHVGINVNTISSAVDKPWNSSEHTGKLGHVWITYNATREILSVLLSYKNKNGPDDFGRNLSMSLPINLMKVIPEWVNIGFSGATGISKEKHTLKSWEFYSTLVSDDNTNRLLKMIKSKKGIIIVSSLGAFLVILGGILVFFLYRRRKNQAKLQKEEETSFNDELERGTGPRRFSYYELESATHNFSTKRKLGEGGFGGVYKGYLIDSDMPIAVKKISKGSRQGRKEYVAEVKIISRLRHRNLVQLIGWCHDKGEFLLVYEFMPNGSLDSHLFGKKAPLSWPLRYKIALGLASGLLYLHEEWEQCVVHRDIKSSNIMLDSNYNVKLGDFGLATVMEHGRFAQTITLAGTLGYMAPEYMSTRKASKESDVYSFGVVALEIATGRQLKDSINEETNMKGLIQWAWDLYGNGGLVTAIDQKIRMEFDAKQFECLMVVGLWCVHPDCNYRPSIKQAIQVLNFEAALPSLPPTMPVPVYHVPVLLPSDGSSGPSMLSTSFEIGR